MIRVIIFFLFAFIFNCYSLKPEKSYNTLPESLKIPFQKISIQTPDKFYLQSWIIPPIGVKDKKTTIIIAYPDAGNMSYYLYYAELLARNGFSIVLFDYRGFGKSTNFKIDNRMLYYDEFVIDLKTVIKWAKTNFKNSKVGVFGFSMGTILTTLATKTEPIDFIIGEGFIYSPDSLKNRFKRSQNKDIILPKSSLSYSNMLNSIKTKMLIFAGLKDVISTNEDVKKIVKQNSNRKIVEFNGKHLEGLWSLTDKRTGDLYIKKIIDFLSN